MKILGKGQHSTGVCFWRNKKALSNGNQDYRGIDGTRVTK